MINSRLKRKPETLLFLSKVIKHPMFKQGYQIIEQVHGSFEPLSSEPGLITMLIDGAEPEGAIILGNTGSGKSTLLKHYLKKTYEEGNDECSQLKVLYVEIEHRTSTKKVISKMLKRLGSKNWKSGNESIQYEELKTLLWQLGVELIIIDEINNLLPRSAGNVAMSVCDFFKMLINEAKIPLVLAGTEEAKKVILKNKELANRLNAVHYMQYFSLATPGSKTDFFKQYMGCIEQAIPVESTCLTTSGMLKRFYIASGGQPRLISKIVSSTLQHADLTAPLEMRDYAQGYLKAFRQLALMPNPFDEEYAAPDLLITHAGKEGGNEQ